MRRRGKPFLWREEAEERWRNKQEQHMHEVYIYLHSVFLFSRFNSRSGHDNIISFF